MATPKEESKTQNGGLLMYDHIKKNRKCLVTLKTTNFKEIIIWQLPRKRVEHKMATYYSVVTLKRLGNVWVL